MKQHKIFFTTTVACWSLLTACASTDSAVPPPDTGVASTLPVATTTRNVTTSQALTTTTSASTPSAPVPSTAPAIIDSIEAPDGGSYSPQIDPSHFTHPIDNPYLPFLPGMKWTYQAVNEEGAQETTTVEVLTDTRTVMGVVTTVVHDLVEVGGKTTEDTHDWYAQDDEGNVWYFGEDTTAYDSDGSSSKEGSWEGGVKGALPGIVMAATPEVTGNGYRQEFLPGTAEDMAIVVATGGDQQVGTDTYNHVVVTQEWTPIEPDVVEQKSYAPGVGVITEDIVRGGSEHVELAGFTPPS